VSETVPPYYVAGVVDAVRLRQLYDPARGRAVTKEMPRLDRHCRRFIELSPFVVVASGAAGGHYDASPRGGEPGFVQVRGDDTLLIPDSPGNNRLDTMENILSTGKVGLLFMVPGIDETLRVNGAARLLDDAATLARFAHSKRPPKLAIEVTVAQAYLHCAKAFMRSKLWDPASRVERSVLPSTGEMIRDQSGSTDPVEPQEAMIERYKALL
jgi:PPOX class probable FMN-dependent enzyme